MLDKLWWIKPHKVTLCFICPLFILLYFLPEKYVVLNYKRYFNKEYFILGLLFFVIFIFSSFVTSKIKLKQKQINFSSINILYLDVLANLTIIAYVIWFRDFIIYPQLFIDILNNESGAVYFVRNNIKTIPGITTLSQLGVVYVTFFIVLQLSLKKKIKKRYYFYFFIIILLTIFRVLAWSERLALIEIVLPFTIILFKKIKIKSRFFKIITFLGPYVGIIMLILFFLVTEFFRSWANHYSNIYSNVIEFTIIRITTYYFTALNNGAGLLENYSWPTYDFSHVLSWLYKIPFLGVYFKENFTGDAYYLQFLNNYADPEFTNMSGIFTIYFDMGIFGAILYAFLWGIIMGYLYKSFIKSSGIGIFLYPVMYISVLESMRILYLSESRFIPIFLFILIGYIVMKGKYKWKLK